MKNKIERAIKQLKLKEEEVKVISYSNLKEICKLAKVDILDLMYYLRYER